MKTLREMMDIVDGKVEEGFGSELKQAWNQGMAGGWQKKLKAKIDPAYHKLYDIDSVKTRDDAIALGKKAREAGHVIDESLEETEGEAQEYTVRVVDEENSGYTVKVTATSEQGALHKAIVKVRNSGARPEHARIIRQDIEETAEDPIKKVEELFKDR